MKKINMIILTAVLSVYSLGLFAQYPTPLNEENFPSVNDSARVFAYMIPATQTFTDDNQANDSLSIDRTIEKAIQANNPLDNMFNVHVGGQRDDTVAVFYYQGAPKPPYTRKYQAYNGFLPGAANFTQANLYALIPTSQGDAHTYYKKDATGFYELGFYTATTMGVIVLTNNPPKPIATFPVDFANPQNVNNLAVTSSSASATVTTTMSITVDAYGDITIIDGNVSNPTYTTYENVLRLKTTSDDNMDLGSGMNYFIKTNIYSYHSATSHEPVATYSVTQLRSNIDPTFWSLAGQWQDEIEFAYIKPFDTPSSIHNEEAPFFQLFPNPTDGLVQVNFENMPNEQISIHIYDMQGKLLGMFERENGAVSFDLSQYPSGTYIVNLVINSRVFPSKIFKQ
jgi:hypothetical protein